MLHSYIKYTLVLPLLFLGCGSSSSNTNTTTNTNNNNNTFKESDISVINDLNNLRMKSSMIALSQNTLLTRSAQNHANYLSYNNMSGHYESDNYQYFTGIAPVDRAKYVYYQSTKVSENVSVGQQSEALSLDGLMGAIYHRFGFLSFDIDEIGEAYTGNSYVYEMGNSKLSILCQGKSFEGTGQYYKNVCLDEYFKIEKETYDNTLTQTKSQNPSYVIYPYTNEEDITPSFYEESPDPLPDYSVSGIPISIEFNPTDFDMSKFSLLEFTLKDENNDSVELVSYNDNTDIMKQSNDINHEFSKYQFAIFPKNRLDYDKKYNATFSYNYDSKSNIINWSFKTKKLENLLIYNGNSLQISLNKKYYIYVPARDNDDVIKSFNAHCTYQQGGSVFLEDSLYDGNTLAMSITGSLVDSCELTLDNGIVIAVDIK